MMTLEEVWENLRQDAEIKATMEEVDKSYKLFKKIENLIVADLETKLAESKNQIRGFQEAIKKRDKKIEGLNKGLSKTQSKSYKIKQSKSQDIITIASQTEKERNLQKQLEDTIEQGICYQAEIHQLKQQLANMTEKYNACQEARKLESEFSQQDKKELIQQLADKEKHIIGQNALLNKSKENNKQLKQQLKDTDKLMQEYLSKCLSLEQQLAEKDEQISKLQTFNKSLNSIKEDMRKKLDLIRTSSKKDYIRNMEQQLAEKDQAIESLQEINQSLGQTCNNDAKEIERLREQLHTANQETLHFQNKYFAEKQIAIEELEKVKEWLELKYFDKEQINYLANQINQQITELKGENL